MITGFKSMIKKGDAKYVDISSFVDFEPDNNNGAITIIATTNSTRVQLSKPLFTDLGEPEAVKFGVDPERKMITVLPVSATSAKAVPVGKERIIYSTPLAKKIIEVSTADVKEKGSTKLGTYEVQEFDEDTAMAVISFE